MKSFSIPKKVTKGDELVVLPKKEYEKLLGNRRVPEFQPTEQDKRALARARKNRRGGKTLTLHELKKKLGFAG